MYNTIVGKQQLHYKRNQRYMCFVFSLSLETIKFAFAVSPPQQQNIPNIFLVINLKISIDNQKKIPTKVDAKQRLKLFLMQTLNKENQRNLNKP